MLRLHHCDVTISISVYYIIILHDYEPHAKAFANQCQPGWLRKLDHKAVTIQITPQWSFSRPLYPVDTYIVTILLKAIGLYQSTRIVALSLTSTT